MTGYGLTTSALKGCGQKGYGRKGCGLRDFGPRGTKGCGLAISELAREILHTWHNRGKSSSKAIKETCKGPTSWLYRCENKISSVQ